MIEPLKSLQAHVITSRMFKRPLRGFDGEIGVDLGHLKRGVRSNTPINTQEAFYRALEQNRLLDVFQMKFPTVVGLNLVQDFDQSIKYARDNVLSCQNFHLPRASSPEEVERIKDNLKHYEILGEAYEFMRNVKPFADPILNGFGKKNLPWDKVTCVQFWRYDQKTNSFVEVDAGGEVL